MSNTNPDGNPTNMGRPRVIDSEEDWKKLDDILELHATLEECAASFKCSVDTVENAVKRKHEITFSEYSAQKSPVCTLSLRRRQIQKALSGDNTMLIWLGKQYLGQSDKSEIKQDQRQIVIMQDEAPVNDRNGGNGGTHNPESDPVQAEGGIVAAADKPKP